MYHYGYVILKWLEGIIPPAAFLLILWVLLEPKCSRRTARLAGAGFLACELALQLALYARSGDPECQAVLSLLDSDLMDIFTACREGTLDKLDIRWKDKAACCLVLASGGYPLDYQKGYPISGLDEAGKAAVVFHAGTKLGGNGEYLTNGGRVLGVTALGDTLDGAIANAYAAAKPVSFQDMHYRTDIGRAF